MTLQNTILFKKYAENKFPAEGQLSSLGSLSQYEKLYKVVKDIPLKSKILDWGCGNGHFSAYLKYLGYSPVAFSFNKPTFIDESDHVLGNSTEPKVIPFPDDTFDYVVSVGVLEHVHETGGSQEESLKELRRILKPNGTLIVYHLPNKYSWIEFCANLLANIKLHSHYTHTKKFNKREIQDMFVDWKIILSARYGMLPRNIFGRIPQAFSKPVFIKGYDILDRFLAQIFNLVVQNHIIIARK